jgi:sigma-E factor negative regulatory protein RseB
MPPGFHLITAAQFILPKHTRPVTHLVYSDGLSTVSLFVEARAANDPIRQQGLARHGIMSLYTRPSNADQITALGDVPPATLMMMADSLQPINKAK